MSWRECNIAPYNQQHMTGNLGLIEKYHPKDSWLQKKGGRERAPLGSSLNLPMRKGLQNVSEHGLV